MGHPWVSGCCGVLCISEEAADVLVGMFPSRTRVGPVAARVALAAVCEAVTERHERCCGREGKHVGHPPGRASGQRSNSLVF